MASCGACLTWSEETGWEVVEAIAPADCDVRRRRLLGLKDGRPWCWLYRAADGRFVARWDHGPLQGCAATPSAAIAGLRQGATCQRTGQVALLFGPSPLAVTLERCAARAAADYQTFVAVVRCRNGFWQEAQELTEAARCYQRACAQADLAGRRS
jgi:hypothetical protein